MRACENKSENIRLVLKGHQRALTVSQCTAASRECAGQRSLPVTNGHHRILTRTYDRLTGGQEVVGSSPASPTKVLFNGIASAKRAYGRLVCLHFGCIASRGKSAGLRPRIGEMTSYPVTPSFAPENAGATRASVRTRRHPRLVDPVHLPDETGDSVWAWGGPRVGRAPSDSTGRSRSSMDSGPASRRYCHATTPSSGLHTLPVVNSV